ncbi:MAG: HAD family hydrolase [Thermoplasmata archaeon]
MTPSTGVDPPYLEPFLGIVFDLDGTLVVSRHDFGRMRREVIRLAERYGVPAEHLSPEDPLHRILERARAEMQGSGFPATLLFRFEADFAALLNSIELEALPRTRAREGAAGLLQGLVDRDFRLGILTRSSEEFCRKALAQTGLARYFSHLRTRSSPGPAKPSPDALRALLQAMEVPRDRALFVGDQLLDADCARAAGVRFYAVLPPPDEPTQLTEDRFRLSGATAVARDLEGLAVQLDVLPPHSALPAR